MSAFTFHTIFEDDRSVEITPDYVRPLGVADIRVLDDNPSAHLNMYLEADEVIVDGEKQRKRHNVKTSIKFHESIKIYSLVAGGWLPLPFAIPSRFLVDRNVIISLRKIREGKTASNAESLKWWTGFFSTERSFFNPLPYALESGFQRKPTFSEFIQAFNEGVSELRDSLPGCSIVTFEEQQYRAAYNLLEDFDSRNENEINFLNEVFPEISQRVSRNQEENITNFILNTADVNHLNRASFVVLAALSCIYENIHGTPTSIGRQVLKPKKIYTEQAVFNALSDIRHIEVAAAGQTYFGNKSFNLCTCDVGLALMWSALSVRGQSLSSGNIEFTCKLNNNLFSRLNEKELIKLRGLLKNSL